MKELRYELNSRLIGRRGNGTYVSARTVRRWVQTWVSSGLVVPTGMRQVGTKGGRPEQVFQVLPPICEPTDVQNPPDFPEIEDRDRDLVLDTGLSITSPEAECVHNPGPVSDKTTETPPEAPEVLDTKGQKKGLSKTPSPETRSSTGVSENEPEVLDTQAQIYRTRFDEGDWSSVDWT